MSKPVGLCIPMDKVSQYYIDCINYETWRDLSGLWKKFMSELNFRAQNRNPEVMAVKKVADQLSELVNGYAELHKRPTNRPVKEIGF